MIILIIFFILFLTVDGCRDLKMEYIKGTDKSGNPILPDVAT